jgi:RNA-directed DNA polymerase
VVQPDRQKSLGQTHWRWPGQRCSPTQGPAAWTASRWNASPKTARVGCSPVKEHLERGSYQPKPVKRVWIPKPGSPEKRPLGIPTVNNRVVQCALRMVVEPIFEREFAPQSYGFRPGRSCHDALRRVNELLQSGYGHVVDIDIKGYFDAIPHERLMARVSEKIADGRVLELIERFLKAGVMEGLRRWEAEMGAPQGAVISPLLANIGLRGGGGE